MKATARVSVVVPCYRPGHLIDGCLADLLAQDLVDPYEIIVVESSGDGTAERLHAAFPTIRVIAPPRRTLPAEAQNIGVAAAQGAFVAITNHDCRVPPGWLRSLLARHAAGDYAAVGGAVLNGTPRSLVGTAAYWSEFNEFTSGRPAGIAPGVPQCNVCFRRTALVGAAPFPTVRFGAEELTFNYELTRAGGVFFFDPGVPVTHLNRTGLGAFLRHQRVLGTGSAMARRLVPLPGAVAARHPILIPLLVPLRIGRLLGRIARRHPRELPRAVLLLPLLAAGYAAWAIGFRQGASDPLDVRAPA
ncbi:MAG: glycosyltransferase [Deltaproteobacteria bacterium]|nr:glycosyltransferase [Deltaproteobacteria bacterium]